MRHDNRLSAMQKAFLRSMRNDGDVMPKVITKLGLKPARVTRWFRHPVFRQSLTDVLREVRRLGDAELELGARVAKRMVSQMVADKGKLDRLTLIACFGVIDAHERLRQRLRRSRARKEPEKPKGSKHPGHDDETGARGLNELEEAYEKPKAAQGSDAQEGSAGNGAGEL